MVFLIVSALVQLSKGRKTIFPFGQPASYSTDQFKKVPSSLLGLALAAMYIFIKLHQSKWKMLLRSKQKKGCMHPMTDLWHVNDVYRFHNFVTAFRASRTELFRIYEEEGGEYHGVDPPTSSKSPRKGKKKTKRKVVMELSDEDSDSCDFV